MRHIDIGRLKEKLGVDKFKAWEAKEADYLELLRGMTKQERAVFFTKHNDWTELYAAMSALSYNKCWYTEAIENSNEWEMDHFRPKNRSKNYDGKVLLPEGYWWLGYWWRNYRLAGTLVNKRRKDKFDSSEEVYGKGDYFPLDLDNCKPIDCNGDIDDEIILLLDPISFRDTTLLSFDENGEPIPTAPVDSLDYKRAIISIELLGLRHSALSRQRKKIWDSCELNILEAQTKFKKTSNPQLKQKMLEESYDNIRKLAEPKSQYSSVAKGCIKNYSKRDGFEWLENVLESL